jgi:FlaA1/EpsC-like NDP-sugar epimerase
MTILFDTEKFIAEHITHRSESFFSEDIARNSQIFQQEILGKTVLVIGGAGTIGSSFIKQVLHYNPRKVLVVDINENGLTELVRDCRSTAGLNMPDVFRTYPINFNDHIFLKLFETEGPFDIVANFAAHKHVRSEKDVYSIEAMLRNNVLNAKKLFDILNEMPPKHFFCVSTDKAANPVNIMGATKKLMEEFALAYSEKFKTTTARFANVAFSNGSLLDGFIQRVLKRQPIACPPDIKRFFVSPQEAGEICLCACILGNSGDIFYPKLGEDQMINFADIVPLFLQALGLKMRICYSEEEAKAAANEMESGMYPVFFVGSNTSGEKTFEEFVAENEQTDMNSYKSLGVIINGEKRNLEELSAVTSSIESVLEQSADKTRLVQLLKTLLPNFEHIETGKTLDDKM